MWTEDAAESDEQRVTATFVAISESDPASEFASADDPADRFVQDTQDSEFLGAESGVVAPVAIDGLEVRGDLLGRHGGETRSPRFPLLVRSVNKITRAGLGSP
jgi:hypothetical protein